MSTETRYESSASSASDTTPPPPPASISFPLPLRAASSCAPCSRLPRTTSLTVLLSSPATAAASCP
jgi:hypothetical protein